MARTRLSLDGQFRYFVTVSTSDRKKIFQNNTIKDLWIQSLGYCHKKLHFFLYGYVLLLDHFHLMLMTKGHRKIEDVMRHVNGVFAQRYNKLANEYGQVIQRRFWDHAIRNEKDFIEKLDYMHKNPLNHGLVDDVEDWPYSSWHNYNCKHKPLIEIDAIDL